MTVQKQVRGAKSIMTMELASAIIDAVKTMSYKDAAEELSDEYPELLDAIGEGDSGLREVHVILLNEVALDYVSRN